MGSAKGNKNIVTVKINNHSTKMKADTGADARVIPYDLYKKITRKPLQKIQQPLKAWLATKPVHPLGCVRLKTQYKSRTINILCLMKEMLYAVRCLKSSEDMILALAGQFKQLFHEPEKFR